MIEKKIGEGKNSRQLKSKKQPTAKKKKTIFGQKDANVKT